jgi:uncharacterized protein YkwD
MKLLFALLLSVAPLFSDLAAAAASPAEMISDFRLKHGEGRVTIDHILNRIALEQARAMAAKDTLDHEVLGPFSSRIATSRAGHAAENIAFGHDSFAPTLDQWIASSEHRRNLLLHNAEYEAPPVAASRKMRPVTRDKEKLSVRPCRTRILGICF